MFIESLARLNHRLQKANSQMTVVAFIIMPAATQSYTIEALKGQAVIKQLQDTVGEITQRMGQRLFEKAARQKILISFISSIDFLSHRNSAGRLLYEANKVDSSK